MTNPNQAIIDSGKKFVLSVTGGGQGVIDRLTRYGGMSRSLIEARVPYWPEATNDFIGGTPDKYVSAECARATAMACYQRALKYAGHTDVFGIAATSSLMRVEGERPGREHKSFIAVQDKNRTITAEIGLKGWEARQEQEDVVNDLIHTAVMWGCCRFADMQGRLSSEDTIKVTNTLAQPHWIEVVHGTRKIAGIGPNYISPRAILSSSCNPLHDGHIDMILSARRQLMTEVDVELCVRNAEKPPLDYTSIRDRIEQTRKKLDAVGLTRSRIILTCLPLFAEKASWLQNCTFVVGADTIARVASVKHVGDYRSLDDLFIDIHLNGGRFLVFPRQGTQDNFHLLLPPRLRSIVDMNADPNFVPSAISSTAIRKETSK